MITYYVHRDGRTDTGRRHRASVARTRTAGDRVGRCPRAHDRPMPTSCSECSTFIRSRSRTRCSRRTIRRSSPYGHYLYVVLHGIDFKQEEHAFETAGRRLLSRAQLTSSPCTTAGAAASLKSPNLCGRTDFALREGPVALMHRIVDRMVDHYRPEVDELESWLDDIERPRVDRQPRGRSTSEILAVKRDIASMRRVVIPQRDVVGRLARREFDLIGQEHAYRFRDVYDQLVRLADEAIIFQDRVTGILDAHLAAVSNQLALVSKVLAGIAVIFGPLTVITGLFGMNVPLPAFPGGGHGAVLVDHRWT